MTQHRFFLSGVPITPGVMLPLPRPVSRQVFRVLRMRPGDSIVLFDGSGSEWQAEIMNASSDGVLVKPGDPVRPNVEPALQVTLCPAVVPAERFELVLQKGVEIGVRRFVPLLTRRVQAKDIAGAERKMARWRRIVIEAAEQSGRVIVPELAAPAGFEDAVSKLRAEGPVLLLWEEERSQGLREALGPALSGSTEKIAIAVGPVGGLTESEVDAASNLGAVVASMGARVLRAETAAIAAVSAVMYEAGEMRGAHQR
jgi:16S rRNA (uracil1498-N3)-methyltransferase